MSSPTSDRGFTLFETIVAAGILVTALAGVAQLFVLSTHLTRRSAASGLALVAAQDKLESLRGLTFGYAEDGGALTAAALAPSSPNSLDRDVEGNFDRVDTGFVRRWRITALAEPPPDAIAIEVCVFKAPAGEADHRDAEACLSTMRTRQP